jgi:hypothetical protein
MEIPKHGADSEGSGVAVPSICPASALTSRGVFSLESLGIVRTIPWGAKHTILRAMG